MNRGATVNNDENSMTNHLRGIEVPIIAQDVCNDSYKDRFYADFQLCAGNMAGGIDACIGIFDVFFFF